MAAAATGAYTPFAPVHSHRCKKCGRTFSTDLPGARWTNRKGNPRYVHPGCDVPGKDWRPVK